MNLTILTSKHSKKSAVVLGDALSCKVINPYQNIAYRGSNVITHPSYNIGCSGYYSDTTFNDASQIATCINKVSTFLKLKQTDTLTVPFTTDQTQAQAWLDEDRIIVNRATITGKANEGVSFSTKGAPGMEDKPLDLDSIIWTRYVNHTRELRAYCIKGKEHLVFHKVDVDGHWEFIPFTDWIPLKLMEQLDKAQQAFDKMFCIAFDILECHTGDYYFLEANSAPSLLVHPVLIPTLAEAIKDKDNVL